MHRPRRFVACLALGLLLIAAALAALRPTGPAQAEPSATGEIALVANDGMDLLWDPTAYPAPQLNFVRWELRRAVGGGALAPLASGTDPTTDFYRDTNLVAGSSYTYRLDVVRCQDPCEVEQPHTVFEDTATAGFFQGQAHRDLTLKPGAYQIGFGNVGSSAAVTAVDGASLRIGAGVTVRLADGLSGIAGLYAENGRLEIDGALLRNISVGFGDYYDTDASGQGWVNFATLENSSISLNGSSQATVQGNTGDFRLTVNHQARLTASGNTMTGGIEVNQQGWAAVEDNEISDGQIRVSGYGAPGPPKASADIIGNVFETAYQNQGIDVSYGARAVVAGNEISWTGFHGSDSTVLISASDTDTVLIAERNKINHGKIAAFWGAEIHLADNVLLGGGSAITVGCVVCGTGIQATGAVERNTVQSGWGLEMWAGSHQLTIRHNCIRDNDPGLTTDDAFMTQSVDARYNYWGSASGPKHPGNPGGSGDRIEGNKVLYDPWDTTPAYCRLAPPPLEKPDVKVDSVEMIQVVEGAKALVENKPTAVKAVVSSDVSLDTPVGLSLLFGGQSTNQFYILDEANLDKTTQFKAPSSTLLFDDELAHTVYFFPGETPLAGSASATVQVDPDDALDEANEANNSKTAVQPVVRTAWGGDPGDTALRVQYLFEKTPTKTSLARFAAANQVAYAQTVLLPVAPIHFYGDVGVDDDLDKQCPPALYDAEIYAKAKYRLLKTANPGFQRYLLRAPYSWWSIVACGTQRMALTGEASYWWAKGAPAVLFYTLEQPSNLPRSFMGSYGVPVSGQTIPVLNGLAVADRRIRSDTWDMLKRNKHRRSVMGQRSRADLWWLDAGAYNTLLGKVSGATGALGPAAATDLALVSGVVSATGPAVLDPVFRLSPGKADATGGGPYAIDFLDAGQNVLASHAFDLAFSYETPTGTVTLEEAAFAFALPLPDATASIVLRDGAVVLDQAGSPSPPEVTLTGPGGGGTLSGVHTVSWTASDPNSDPLTYAVFYSPDSGATWEPLGMDLTDTSLQWDTDASAGADGTGQLKVLASDGFHTAEDLSAPLSVANKEPAAAVLRPIDEAVYSSGAAAVLEGVAFDPEEGWLAGAAMSWHSSLDGGLGSGNPLTVTLSTGQHLVELTAVDGGGLQGTAQLTITVGAETRPDLSITAASLSHDAYLGACKQGWLAAEVRNVVATASAIISFYEGDPALGGGLIGSAPFEAPANAYEMTAVDWIPKSPGPRDIHVVISAADPAESDAANNRAVLAVEVAEGHCGFLPVVRK